LGSTWWISIRQGSTPRGATPFQSPPDGNNSRVLYLEGSLSLKHIFLHLNIKTSFK
jgi:hypothetical protein